MLKKALFTIAICMVSCIPAIAEDLKVVRIAGIFEENIPHKQSVTQEMLCFTQAVFNEAKINGLSIELKVFDNKRSALETSRIAKTIVKQGFDIAMGTANSSEAIAASEILNKAKIPFFVPNATNPSVSDNKPYVVRMVAGDRIQAKVLANYSIKKFNPKEVVTVINVSRKYSVFLASEYEAVMKRISPNIKVVNLEIYKDYGKYKALIEKIVKMKPNLVFLPLIATRAGNVYREFSKNNSPIVLLGSDGIGGRDSFFRMIGKTSPKIKFLFLKHFNGNLEGPEKDNYLKLHRKYCSSIPKSTFFTVLGYDMASIIVKAIEADPKARHLKIIKNLSKLKFHGTLGKIETDKNGETIRPFHVFSIQDNTKHYLETYSL